jgi:hypothetical protein
MATTHQATSATIISPETIHPNQSHDTALEKLSVVPIPKDTLGKGSRDMATEDSIVVLTGQTPGCHEMGTPAFTVAPRDVPPRLLQLCTLRHLRFRVVSSRHGG